ncbi:MAG TPA: hypothetical protein DHV36_19240 [Desulfobacteraceae bacterium]|nr:hypothetical protein [Desulfobacteraceae bacterium]
MADIEKNHKKRSAKREIEEFRFFSIYKLECQRIVYKKNITLPQGYVKDRYQVNCPITGVKTHRQNQVSKTGCPVLWGGYRLQDL